MKFRSSLLVILLLAFLVSLILQTEWKGRPARDGGEALEGGWPASPQGEEPAVTGPKAWPGQKPPKPEHPDVFARYHLAIRTRDTESRPSYPLNYRMAALRRAGIVGPSRALRKAGTPLPWVERGPANVGGRTRGLIVDPDDSTASTWFAGSVGGGIWWTDDAGQHWRNLTPDLPNLATTALAMAPSNHDVIYAGTGEGFYNVDAINGDGLFKSTDRGQSWVQLPSTAGNPDFQNINRIWVHPEDENTVLVCSNTGFLAARFASGIFRSTDGGATWSKVFDGGDRRVQQIVGNPENPNTLYAAVNGRGVVRSLDGGRTWQWVWDGGGAVRRIELAIAPSDSARIYAAVEGGNRTARLYVSSDAGDTWLEVVDRGPSTDWLGGQGWYNNTIAVHPFDPDVVFVGGINVWRLDLEPGSLLRNTVTRVEENGTESFLAFVDFGGEFLRGGMSLGTDFALDLADSEFVSVELRFGPGLTQMAHRFSAPDGAGIPLSTYQYEGYVAVPFQVWDVTHNRQLMVSFRDRLNDGAFDLTPLDRNNLGREYIFINAVPYDAENPHPQIAQTGGQRYKTLYFLWPILAPGAEWEPQNLPEAQLRIEYGVVETRFRNSTELTNWYPGRRKPEGGFFPFVHADHHNLILVPLDTSGQRIRIIDANDGGVEFSDDGGLTWSKANFGYNTSQFYGVDRRPGANQFIGGTQDNGTWRSFNDPDHQSPWLAQLGGDGFQSVWHSQDPDKLIGTIQFNSIWRSINGGQSWHAATEGLADLGRNAPFITNVASSRSDPDLLFAVGASGVWRSDNFAQDWTLSPVPAEEWGFDLLGTRVTISLADPQIVWAGARMSSKGRIHVSTDGGLTFQPTRNFDRAPLGRISGLATHPYEDSTAFVLFSFAGGPKVLRTRDLGQTWEDLSGFGEGGLSANGFPDVAVYSLLVLPHRPKEIWAGTEIGLFVSTDDGASWAFADNGLPAVSIWEMKVVDDQIVVATHGRGVWAVRIPELSNHPPPAVTLAPRVNRLTHVLPGAVKIDLSLRSAYDSTQVWVNETPVRTLFNDQPVDTAVIYPVTNFQTAVVQAVAFKNGRTFKSGTRALDVFRTTTARLSYVNDFDSGETPDFVGDGFSVRPQFGFDSPAIHTVHPYPENRELVYYLTVPIVVAASNALLEYEDVALVEPGNPSSEAGKPDFKDFVVVEATRDGRNWRALLAGYDANADPTWTQAYVSGEPGDGQLLRKQRVNLKERFAPGDTILIRFRLFSDEHNAGWGWVIDNLRIQENVTSVEATPPLPTEFSLGQNYPNPFNAFTRIQYGLPGPSRVSLVVFNVLGQKVRTLLERRSQEAGFHSVDWDGRDDSGREVGSGLYVYRLQAGDFVQAKKMTLLR